MSPFEINSLCSFCIDTIQYNGDHHNCRLCKCPKEICSNQASKGFIYIMSQKFKTIIEYKHRNKEFRNDLKHMQSLFKKYIIESKEGEKSTQCETI